MSPQGRRSLADRKYDQGLKKLIAREYEDALRYFLWAIKECPDVEDFYVKRSECYLVIGDFVRALSDAHEALKLNPESGDIKARIADCMAYLENDVRDLMQKKRFDDCLEIIEKVHKISPGNVILNVLCIKILMEKDKIESAQIINKINLVMEIASRKNDLSAFPPHEKLKLIDNEYPQISIENGEINFLLLLLNFDIKLQFSFTSN